VKTDPETTESHMADFAHNPTETATAHEVLIILA
jgi:hypothetical protein